MYTRTENVIENFHGTDVVDHYRWLEDESSEEVKEWTNKQQELTKKYFDKIPIRDSIKDDIIKYTDFPKYSSLKKKGDYYYFFKNDGLQNQPVFYRSKSSNFSDLEEIINPNELNDEGTAAVTNISFSPDHSMMAYAISYNGSDWQEIKIKNLETGKDYPELLEKCKFTNISWSKDSKGFFYSCYPNADDFSLAGGADLNSVYWHVAGTQQADDELVYQDAENSQYSYVATVSDDDKYIILSRYYGTERINNVYYKSQGSDEDFITLIDGGEGYYSYITNEDDVFYFYTTDNAPKGRVIAINIKHPEKENWEEVIAEGKDTLSIIKLINNKFVITYLHDAYSIVKIFNMDGSEEKQLQLPDFISVYEVNGEKEDTEMFVGYTSYAYPLKIDKYDFEKDALVSVTEEIKHIKSESFETKQIFYTSKDGTKIPMFITHKKGLNLTGDVPTLLYGYGGYNASMTPSYSASQLMWLESGGVYAVANIRGGGEYGQEWNHAGILEKKQNVFDDFIVAAEWLIESGYTKPERLAIMGASNGGLLVGACINQRPDLFGAALCMVPVTDILRFHRFTVGHFWTKEFGNAEENPEHFEFMYKYSPLHNVKDGTRYPATLITTADTDDRVVPLHAKKFAARLQAAQAGENPILLRVEKNAGHGMGKPTSKVIEEQTDLYTFLFNELDIQHDF